MFAVVYMCSKKKKSDPTDVEMNEMSVPESKDKEMAEVVTEKEPEETKPQNDNICDNTYNAYDTLESHLNQDQDQDTSNEDTRKKVRNNSNEKTLQANNSRF